MDHESAAAEAASLETAVTQDDGKEDTAGSVGKVQPRNDEKGVSMVATDLPFHDVPPPPAVYTAGTVLGRLINGLGFRFRWATEGLTDGDVAFRPSESARTTGETLKHIHDIVEMIEFVLADDVYLMPLKELDLAAVDWRGVTLQRVRKCSEGLKSLNGEKLERLQARFQVGDKEHVFPFWNAINGMMSDALYHVGQIASFRRASGNPIDPTAHVFLGVKLTAAP